ncbi:MAG: glycosyltransferase family 9 protein [Acidobacteriota bacterium]
MPRALLIKLGAIGDCIMAVPAAHALHQQGYQVDWVCGQAAAPILALYPWINLHVIDDHALLRGTPVQRIRVILALWRRFAGQSFDLCATLYYDSRYKLITLPIRARRKVLLSHTDRSLTLLPGRHHTDEYLRILTGRPDGETPARTPPVAPTSIPPSTLLPQPAKHRILLVPAGARNMMRDDALRRWPVESYVSLASTLFLRGFEVVLVGGPDDAWASPLFTHLPVVDLIGKLSLVETLSLLDSAAVTVTHDTGPLHLAGITSTAIVSLFGPTDPNGRLPQRPNAVALWGGEDFACRPCYDGRDFAACTHNGCIRQLTPSMVLAEIDLLLAARTESRNLLPIVRSTPIATQAR